MTCCFTPEYLANFAVTVSGTITNADTEELLPAVAGRKLWIQSATIEQSVTGTTTIVLQSDSSSILICGSDDRGTATGILIEDNDLSVVTTGTGTSFYTVTYVFI